MMRPFTLRHIVSLLAVVGATSLLGACGRTLVFAESTGVNLAIKTNATSSTPVEVNFGLNRTVGTIVPPAGQKGNRPNGEAVNMFAGFEINNDYKVGTVGTELTIDTQFASGQAAKTVAGDPALVAKIVNVGNATTFSTSDSSAKLEDWLIPGGRASQRRSDELQKWLIKRYPGRMVRPFDFLGDDELGEFDVGRKVALKDTVLMSTPEK